VIGGPGPGSAKDVVAFAADDGTRAAVSAAVSLAGVADCEVREGELSAALAYLSSYPAPATLVVDLSGCDDIFDCLDRLADACEPRTRVIAIGAVNDIELYRKLLEMGVTDYLAKPVSPQTMAASLRRVRHAETAPTHGPPTTLRKIALIGAKGGVGATSLALSLGTAMAERLKRSTMLLDLDLRFGAMAMSLDLEPSRGLREILSTPERIDTLLIESAVTPAADRLRLLSAEEPLEAEFSLPAEGIATLLKWLEGHSDIVLIDVPRHLDALGKAALDAADAICIVTDLSLVGMRDSKRMLALAQAAGGETLIVANRVGGVPGEVPQAEFERAIGTPFDYVIPVDAKAAAAAADRGKSLLEVSSNKSFAEAVNELAVRLAGSAPEASATSGSPSWIKKILR
jgi:pilus assembly protein CpaE